MTKYYTWYSLWSIIHDVFGLSRMCWYTTALKQPWFLAVSIEATSLNMALLQRDQLKIKELQTAKMVRCGWDGATDATGTLCTFRPKWLLHAVLYCAYIEYIILILYIYIYIYTLQHIYIYIYIYIYTYIHTYTHICLCVCVILYIYIQ